MRFLYISIHPRSWKQKASTGRFKMIDTSVGYAHAPFWRLCNYVILYAAWFVLPCLTRSQTVGEGGSVL